MKSKDSTLIILLFLYRVYIVDISEMHFFRLCPIKKDKYRIILPQKGDKMKNIIKEEIANIVTEKLISKEHLAKLLNINKRSIQRLNDILPPEKIISGKNYYSIKTIITVLNQNYNE